jgi:hypothetical protein
MFNRSNNIYKEIYFFFFFFFTVAAGKEGVFLDPNVFPRSLVMSSVDDKLSEKLCLLLSNAGGRNKFKIRRQKKKFYTNKSLKKI